MIFFIVQTPNEILQDRVIPCLSVVDLVRLDSSVLNHVIRPLLLEQLSGALVCTQSIKLNEHAARWFVNRKVFVSSLRVAETTVDLTFLKQLAVSVESLVSFDFCHSVPVEAIKDFMQSCAKVKALSFRCSYDDDMDGRVIFSVAAHCVAVQSTSLCINSVIDIDHLQALTMGCKLLTDIDLSGCWEWVGDDCCSVLSENCAQLQKLSLDCCSLCGDKTLQVLAQYCRDLRYVSLRHVSFMTDEGVGALTACAELRALIISLNDVITSVGIITLAQGCTKLEEIGIPECDREIDTAIAALVQYCPALKVVHCDSLHFKASSLRILQHCPQLTSLELTFQLPP